MMMKRKKTYYATFGKRLFDLVLTIPGAVVISPVLVAIALLVRIKLGSPVLFRQERAGLNGRSFMLYKFRTMGEAYDTQGRKIPDEERTGKFGRFLRSSSLDEFPELWKVIKGEMSLVGPRPLFVEYLPYYTKKESRRHKVRPGLTGLAQISGRNTLNWDERLALDVAYVDRYCFRLDCWIIFSTFKKVIKKEDVHAITGGRCRLDEYRRNISNQSKK